MDTAVIVAAGRGSRVGSEAGSPKPLKPIVGVPVIRRVMSAAARAGITRFVVVVGFGRDVMCRELPGLVPDGCTLDIVENPRYNDPNGVSLLAAAETLTSPFCLLMSDHIFDPSRLRAAIESHRRDPGCLLVVEDRGSFDGDPEDATFVKLDGDLVTAIGKDLPAYDAVDTGIFVLGPGMVTDALRRAGPYPSISEGMRVLAGRGQLRALRLDTGWWQDLDTPEDFQAGEEKLYRSLVKPTDGPLARLINRRVSLFLTRRLWGLGVGPNMVTTFTLALGLLAGAAFAHGGGAAWGLAGAVLFQLQSIIDGVDGELARLMLKESRFGFWYDLTVDNLSHMAVFAGIAAGRVADGEDGPWAALGVLAVVGVAAAFAVMAPLLRSGGGAAGAGGREGRLKKMVEGVSRRDFTYLLFPAAAFGLLGEFLWLVVVGTWVFVAAVVFLRFRSHRGAR